MLSILGMQGLDHLVVVPLERVGWQELNGNEEFSSPAVDVLAVARVPVVLALVKLIGLLEQVVELILVPAFGNLDGADDELND